MLMPGSNPAEAFSTSSKRRFNNDQVRAVRGSMPHNAAAQQAIRTKYSGGKPAGPAVGGQMEQTSATTRSNNTNRPGTNMGMPPTSMGSGMELGGPQGPEMGEEFDPGVFVENTLNEVVGRIMLDRFLESPQVKDSMTQLRIKNIMNGSNANRVPDSRSLLDQVLSRMGRQ